MKKLSVFNISTFIALFLCAFLSTAHAGEAEIRKSLQAKFPGIGALDHVVRTPFADLYEVIIDEQLMYTDSKGQYLFEGSVYDAKTRRDLSKERRRQLFKIDFDKLPLDLAVKKVKGNGKRRMALFTDPNCSFCKKLEGELNKVTNVTIYLFLYPTFPGSPDIVRNVLCSKDPYKTWEDMMLNDIMPKRMTCNTNTEQVLALGGKLRINGTPNMIFASGMQTPGFAPAEALEVSLNEAASN
ncbi:MAG: DsbC family protein [Gallionella sp.]|nr:DsbC family protein [Gallionella sp.]